MVVFANPLTQQITDFISEIGIPVQAGEIPDNVVLPGILIDKGVLVVDETKLKYPGDLLHEAGHLAVMDGAQRNILCNDVSKNAGDEIAALAWSWAALVHLNLKPEVVFHPDGYKGESEWLIDIFSNGSNLGVPLLQWMGLTAEPSKAEQLGWKAFPQMQRWLRE
ncbi:hypothetical protein V3O24_08535 [Methylobacter sp. Wu8]|uniref:Uncharacterized protein n=1 Tax=Methylobacter tundripaludum TaxID=173365 RepID=A0A2S6H2K0_9GAMM|nr:hypothetical protein [Methylobacter tundripaludum]MCF7966657.1 hypothetical protein [Methylobacter tundripaludum]MCK9636223.1 hypothetical protein [Methylobacter tundripaludum]PPK71683.1 hypothetical protein B0F88_10631 [Methylobacter tundripaludum]